MSNVQRNERVVGLLTRYLPLVALFTLAIVGSSMLACRRASTNAKRYELKGKVVSVEPDKHLVTIAHEEIKDFMPGMTMPFTVPDDSAYSILRPGDEISGLLVVDGTRSWLEELVIRQESTDVSTKSNTPAEAKPGDEVPNYGLVNQDGKPIKLHNYRGKALLLTFIYTRCPMPDQCTLMSENFASINQQLEKRPELYGKTHLLSVSFDPDYDTPTVLRSYGAAHTGRYSEEDFQHWEFASGTKDQVKGIAQYFGLRYYEGNDEIVHGLRTALITPDGKIYKVYRGNEWKPEEVLGDLKTLLKAESQ
ncbi:MAG TPA: SCO family protein [Pyrinomonadaceae bacterium]|nr:SCO family protein [Pyrinomonadaceae bacterium]